MTFKYHCFTHFLPGLIFLISCSNPRKAQRMDNNTITVTTAVPADTLKTDDFLDSLLKQYSLHFANILQNRKDLNVQVIYTQVNRGSNGIPNLKSHYFNVNPARYFYPASTVKLPIVLLALQKMNELKEKGIDRNTTMLTETSFSGQTAVYNDPTSSDGKPSIGHYIKKILLVSDNDAYNRLYEFLGQEYINTELHKRGYKDAQILHRLEVFLSPEENRQTNPIIFSDSSSNVLHKIPGQRSAATYVQRNDSLGNAYYKGGVLMNGAMDFSKKNRLSLEDLHHILLGVIFPDKVIPESRFNITEEDRQFVLKYMSQYPTESVYPPYSSDTVSYWPAYCKFLLFGATKEKLPGNIRIFNKPGDAYGHLIDVAYVADFKNNIEFFVSALIYCNSDGVLNDDKYDYVTVGKPFMKNLGQVIYKYELQRTYKIKPDLTPFKFTYDTAPPIR